jgi:hypothetical protein
MDNLIFSYIKGTSHYIDWLCESNKLILLKDTHLFTEEIKKDIERLIEMPIEELVVLQFKKNISSLAWKKVRESCNKDKKVRVYNGTQQLMVFDWQSLANLIKEYDITSFFDPQRTM